MKSFSQICLNFTVLLAYNFLNLIAFCVTIQSTVFVLYRERIAPYSERFGGIFMVSCLLVDFFFVFWTDSHGIALDDGLELNMQNKLAFHLQL